MTLEEAKELRDKYKPLLVGQPLISSFNNYPQHVNITDVVVTTDDHPHVVVMHMWYDNITNDEVLTSYADNTQDFKVFVVHFDKFATIINQELSTYLKTTSQLLENSDQ